MKWLTAPLLMVSMSSHARVPTAFKMYYLPVAIAVEDALTPGQHPNPNVTLAELGGFDRAKFDRINQNLVDKGGPPADANKMKWSLESLERHSNQITVSQLIEMIVIARLGDSQN